MNHFSHLRQQVRACLERESKLTPSERKLHQWQFVTTVAGVPYVVGKGGANTMFYQVGIKGERKLCMPKEMLDIISDWNKSKYAMYAICKTKSKYRVGPVPKIDGLLEGTGRPGEYIVGITSENKVVRLYICKSGITESVWVPFKSERKH